MVTNVATFEIALHSPFDNPFFNICSSSNN